MEVYFPPEAELRGSRRGDVFYGQVSRFFRREGFAGNTEYQPHTGRPGLEGGPLLRIRLIEWREDVHGMWECAFRAMVVDSAGEADLGVFSGSASGRNVNTQRDLQRAIEGSAAGAIRELWRHLLAEGYILPSQSERLIAAHVFENEETGSGS